MSHYTFCLISGLFFTGSLLAQNTAEQIPLPKPVKVQIELEKLQHYLGEPYTFDSNGTFRVSAYAFSQSNCIPTEFSNAFIFPKFIDEPMKEAAYKRLKDNNSFGAELSFSAMASFSPDSIWKSQGLQFRIGMEQKTMVSAEFSKDLFHVLFGGNAAYAGMKAELGNSAFLSTGYQSLKIGVLQRNKHSMMSVDLGLVHGINLTQLNLNRASLYTQEIGLYLDLDWQGSFLQTGRISNQFKNTPSMGASIDFDYRQQFGNRTVLQVKVNDLGFINWNSSTSEVKSDTAFRFTGLQFQDLLNLDKNATITVGDSLFDKIRGDEVKTSQLLSLPTLFKVGVSRLLNPHYTLDASIQYRYIPGYQPLYTIEASRLFGYYRSVKLGLMYGGYGGFQTSLNVQVFNTLIHSLSIGTRMNEGFINTGSWSGAGIQFSYQHRL